MHPCSLHRPLRRHRYEAMSSPRADPRKRSIPHNADEDQSSNTKPAKSRRVSSTNPKSKASQDDQASDAASQDKPGASLSSWLKIPPPPPLPEPFYTTKPIFDRDSIFLGYALPLAEPSVSTVNSYIARLPHDHPDLPDVVAGRGRTAESSGAGGSGKLRRQIKPNHNMWAYKVG